MSLRIDISIDEYGDLLRQNSRLREEKKAAESRAVQAEEKLRLALAVIEFYGNPETYFAIGFIPDRPCGAFIDDFEDTHLGSKPGKFAREKLKAIEETK